MEGHGGRIWATNNATGNGGATFSFILPNDLPLDNTIVSPPLVDAMKEIEPSSNEDTGNGGDKTT